MKNYWVQKKSSVAEWFADLSAFAAVPEMVTALLLRMTRLAESYGVAIVNSADVEARLRETFGREGRIDCAFMRGYVPRARMAWFDTGDHLVEGEVTDLGRLLRALAPVEGAITKYDSAEERPLEISGSSLYYEGSRFPGGAMVGERILTFAIYSDIWFPFVTGDAHPSCDGVRYFDNRDLAERHTPRLNGFLNEVADAVVAAGGSWAVEHDCVARTLAAWVGERGILLDGPVPDLMPPELVDVPWPQLEE